ncbi:hypothetical protein GXW78_27275 [Roseomonas terrae]|uniref:Uncharacterized protein n=1 Tax=Neoroseomonas terrae TaxID=424799 RepID=A0ABS5ERV4_9PROT|nr:hypothetical protein [Neoroseomonas terrae]MBR0653382.1 hypothetical protein [Neoroseomonas terrae]
MPEIPAHPDGPFDGRGSGYSAPAEQTTHPPTVAELFARIEDLPMGLSGLARSLLNTPGLTADHVLIWAEAADKGVEELRLLFPTGSFEGEKWTAFAAILRDAAPRFPHPPRLPASARERDDAMRVCAAAAGLATAAGVPGR